MTLSSRDRADLRKHAHHLEVAVHIGKEGLTAGVRQTLDDVLRTRELVKIQFAKNSEVKAKQAANDLAREMGADVVQAIGRTVTLFRLNPELEEKRRAKASADTR
jgi:RNA-binding protein